MKAVIEDERLSEDDGIALDTRKVEGIRQLLNQFYNKHGAEIETQSLASVSFGCIRLTYHANIEITLERDLEWIIQNTAARLFFLILFHVLMNVSHNLNDLFIRDLFEILVILRDRRITTSSLSYSC
jgi:hypothetical protein